MEPHTPILVPTILKPSSLPTMHQTRLLLCCSWSYFLTQNPGPQWEIKPQSHHPESWCQTYSLLFITLSNKLSKVIIVFTSFCLYRSWQLSFPLQLPLSLLFIFPHRFLIIPVLLVFGNHNIFKRSKWWSDCIFYILAHRYWLIISFGLWGILNPILLLNGV